MAARLQEIKRKLTELKKDLGAGVGVQGLLFAAKEANVAGVNREIVKNFFPLHRRRQPDIQTLASKQGRHRERRARI